MTGKMAPKLSEGAVARLQAGETSADSVVLRVRGSCYQTLYPESHQRTFIDLDFDL